MSYQRALEAAGARIIAFEEFGSYQGTWVARVEYGGETGWVIGSYGSCSGCDAFEAEFGWSDPDEDELAAFGKTYLDGLLNQEQAEKHAGEYAEWSMEDAKALKFVRAHAEAR